MIHTVPANRPAHKIRMPKVLTRFHAWAEKSMNILAGNKVDGERHTPRAIRRAAVFGLWGSLGWIIGMGSARTAADMMSGRNYVASRVISDAFGKSFGEVVKIWQNGWQFVTNHPLLMASLYLGAKLFGRAVAEQTERKRMLEKISVLEREARTLLMLREAFDNAPDKIAFAEAKGSLVLQMQEQSVHNELERALSQLGENPDMEKPLAKRVARALKHFQSAQEADDELERQGQLYAAAAELNYSVYTGYALDALCRNAVNAEMQRQRAAFSGNAAVERRLMEIRDGLSRLQINDVKAANILGLDLRGAIESMIRSDIEEKIDANRKASMQASRTINAIERGVFIIRKTLFACNIMFMKDVITAVANLYDQPFTVRGIGELMGSLRYSLCAWVLAPMGRLSDMGSAMVSTAARGLVIINLAQIKATGGAVSAWYQHNISTGQDIWNILGSLKFLMLAGIIKLAKNWYDRRMAAKH